MPVSILILVFLVLTFACAVAGFLTKKRFFYGVAIILGLLAVLTGIGIALSVSRM